MKEQLTVAKATMKEKVIGVTSAIVAFCASNPLLAGLCDWEQVNVSAATNASASNLMGKILGILLTITRYVGVALVVYGVYEVVMSFTNDQPEKKVKGITMALAGVVMIGLKSVLTGIIS